MKQFSLNELRTFRVSERKNHHAHPCRIAS